MVSNRMSKDGSVFISLISVRRTVTIATLLVVCSLAPWSHSATADEINATTAAKPVGFAEIVGKVKPAVIAVTVRLERGAQMEARNPTRTRNPSHSARTHPCTATSSAALSASHRPLGRSKWPWDQVSLFPLMDMR